MYYMYTNNHSPMALQRDTLQEATGPSDIYIYIYIYVHMYICICISLSLSLYIYIYMYNGYIIVLIQYVCMHTMFCIYIYIYTYHSTYTIHNYL